jgi:signal transduction histidine kinase
MRETDWASSALGPVGKWPQALKTAVRIMLTSRQPMFVWWGNDLINLYNDAYRSILGGKHPWALGVPAQEVWREIWDEVGPRARSAIVGNTGTYDEALGLIMERNGYPEETYYTFSYSPVPNDEGGTGGILCANTDDTQKIIGERQLGLLRELAARAAEARTIDDACRISAHCLETNAQDVPFALIYLADRDHNEITLKGLAGIERGHAAAPEFSAVEDDSAWPFAEVLATNQPMLVADLEARFGSLPKGAWQQAPTHAVAAPIMASGKAGLAGVLVVGLNPFRLFNDSYRGFLGLVSSQIAAALDNAQTYEEERKRAEALAELDRAKTTFFSNVSHEFRTPLMLMLTPVEEALADTREPLTPLQRERLTLVERNGLRMLKLVNTLLDFARIEAGRVQAMYVETDLCAYTAELASLFRSAVERAGMELAVDCQTGLQPAFIDREMWEKIVLNLLSNAFKYTFEGSIRVTLGEREGKARLTVEDTGIGIAADQLGRVFERFHRIEGARGRTIEGTGIGLALVQELTRLHGGTVGAESHEGLGSRFTVEIPLGHAHLPAECIQATPEPALRWLTGDLRQRSFEPLAIDGVESVARLRIGPPSGEPRERVLLVDDNADMPEYVGRLLGEQYNVEVAPNGRVALEAIERHVPDIVLSDVMMPELDGFGLVEAIRGDSRLATLPVILISARAGEEATVEGLEQGADDYLVKPFTAGELKARVASNLKLARLRRDAADREQQLRGEAERAEARMVEALESITDGFISLDRDGRYTYVNHVAAGMGKQEPRGLIGKVLWDEFPETRDSDLFHALQGVMRDRQPAHFDFHNPASGRSTEWHAWPTADGVAALITEVTQKRRLEAQLQQSAKLESLGVLAGGVAHDFNNLLVGILGNASLAEDMLPDSHPAKEVVHEAVRASERAAELTRQLLAYSGKGRFVVELVDLADLVRDNLVLLKTSIAANVELKTVLPENLAAVRADRAQMQQVVMNLMINAAEAIGSQPGQVSLELREVEVSDGSDLAPGAYVRREVRDNGCGMPRKFRTESSIRSSPPNSRGGVWASRQCRALYGRITGRFRWRASRAWGQRSGFCFPPPRNGPGPIGNRQGPPMRRVPARC